jgi:hypothetical protein
MINWFRWRHWRARAKFWQRLAEKAEARAVKAEQQLTAELWRNIQRGDLFTSAAIMGQRGMWGVAPRSGPAEVTEPKKQAAPTADPYDLRGPDLMEFETFWKPDAEAAGIPINEAKRRFVNEVVLPRRMPLNDDPYGNSN